MNIIELVMNCPIKPMDLARSVSIICHSSETELNFPVNLSVGGFSYSPSVNGESTKMRSV